MARPRRERRGDELWCEFHQEWHHHTRFGSRIDRRRQNTDVPFRVFDRVCKLALQTQRVAEKHQDEALHVITGRAQNIVRKANSTPGPKITVKFVMEDLNYRALVPLLRAFMQWPEEAVCLNCGERPDDIPHLHLDHRAPPRHGRDWARLHARNINVLDHNCNLAKHDIEYEVWLEREEERRVSAKAHIEREESRFDLIARAGRVIKVLFDRKGRAVGDQPGFDF